MKTLAALSILLVAAATAATTAAASGCSSSDPGTGTPPAQGDPGTGTAPGNGGGSGAAPGSTAPGGSTPGTGTPATETKVKSGIVSLTQTSFDAGGMTFNSYTAFAGFSEGTVATLNGASCKQSTDAACNITECATPASQPDAGAPDGGVAAPVKAPTAGDITIAAGQTITLSADATGNYAAKTGQVELFAPGAMVQIDAKGDTVPAFSKALTSPAVVTLTAPTWPAAGQSLALDHTKELALAWSGGGTGDVGVTLTTSASGAVTVIACKFPSNANQGTISAAAMGKLLVTDSGSISMSASSSESFEQDGWKLQLSANSPVKAGSSFASGVAKVQ